MTLAMNEKSSAARMAMENSWRVEMFFQRASPVSCAPTGSGQFDKIIMSISVGLMTGRGIVRHRLGQMGCGGRLKIHI